MLDLTTRDPREVRALREELPDEAVGVLVRASLPGAMRVGEVDLDARLLCEQLMLGHLFAFVLWRGLMKAHENKPNDWTSLSNGFAEAIPLHIAIDPVNSSHLALTTQNNGVLESIDGGVTWSPFGNH